MKELMKNYIFHDLFTWTVTLRSKSSMLMYVWLVNVVWCILMFDWWNFNDWFMLEDVKIDRPKWFVNIFLWDCWILAMLNR